MWLLNESVISKCPKRRLAAKELIQKVRHGLVHANRSDGNAAGTLTFLQPIPEQAHRVRRPMIRRTASVYSTTGRYGITFELSNGQADVDQDESLTFRSPPVI